MSGPVWISKERKGDPDWRGGAARRQISRHTIQQQEPTHQMGTSYSQKPPAGKTREASWTVWIRVKPLLYVPHSCYQPVAGGHRCHWHQLLTVSTVKSVRMWHRGRTTPRRGGDINTRFLFAFYTFDITASKDLNEETVGFYYSFYSSVIFIQFLYILCVAVFSARCHIIALICTVSNNASSSMGVCWWSKLTVVQSLLSHLYTKNI